MKTKNGICKFCDTNKQLCDSHIVPEFFYKEAYDLKHRFHKILNTDQNPNSKFYAQKGLREYLLCGECEGKFNENYEKTFNKFWYDQNNAPEIIDIKKDHHFNFDHDLLKGLLLSILWRASVAEGDYFSSVSLGPHEDKIKKIIKQKKIVKNSLNYSVLGMIVTDDDGVVVRDLVVPPAKIKLNGHNFYAMIFGGVQWMVKMSSHKYSKYSELYLDNEGNLPMLQIHHRQSIAKMKLTK